MVSGIGSRQLQFRYHFSTSNVATTSYHPRPYKLHWMNDCGELKVNKQAKVTITLGHYEDTILSDVVPMQACHILLGRPWQFDRKVMLLGMESLTSGSREPMINVGSRCGLGKSKGSTRVGALSALLEA